MAGRAQLTACVLSVSTAIVQRYLTVILETAISTTISIQKVAIDILSFTVTQGLAHPLQVSF
jgi:cohesin loading factor subunit SCC2